MQLLRCSGKFDTALNVGLDDLLRADSHGKWYLVGSAWHGADSTKSGTAYSGWQLACSLSQCSVTVTASDVIIIIIIIKKQRLK